jgi:hypothetical protein
MHQALSQAAPEPPRNTSDPDQRYYGEAPMGLRRCERAVENAVPPITPKMPILIPSGISKEMGVSTGNNEEP